VKNKIRFLNQFQSTPYGIIDFDFVNRINCFKKQLTGRFYILSTYCVRFRRFIWPNGLGARFELKWFCEI